MSNRGPREISVGNLGRFGLATCCNLVTLPAVAWECARVPDRSTTAPGQREPKEFQQQAAHLLAQNVARPSRMRLHVFLGIGSFACSVGCQAPESVRPAATVPSLLLIDLIASGP